MIAALGLAASATADVVPARRVRPGRSAASATRSRSRSKPTSRRCRRRSRPSSTTSAPSTSTGSRCCATRCSRSTTCSCRCSRRSAGSCRLARHARAARRRSARCSCSSPLFAIPIVITATWRPGVERRIRSRSRRTTGSPGTCSCSAPPRRRARSSRVEGIGDAARARPARGVGRSGTSRSPAPARSRALWHTLAWALFGGAYVGAIVYVAVGLDASVGDVVLVVTAGSRLSQYVGAAVGELGFLRGIWLDSSRGSRGSRTTRRARPRTARSTVPEPHHATASAFEHVSFAYPGTDHDGAHRRRPRAPRGRGDRARRRERRGQEHAREAARRHVHAHERAHHGRRRRPRAHGARRVARPPRRARSRTSSASSSSRRRASASATTRTSTTTRGRARASGAPARTT